MDVVSNIRVRVLAAWVVLNISLHQHVYQLKLAEIKRIYTLGAHVYYIQVNSPRTDVDNGHCYFHHICETVFESRKILAYQ